MLYSFTQPKKHQLLVLPHPQSRGNSLKNSQAHFLSHLHSITKRHSLDSRHPSNPHKHPSILDNAQDLPIPPKNNNSKGLAGKGVKMVGQDNFKGKYYLRGKHERGLKKDRKGKASKSRGVWSQLAGHLNRKQKVKYLSRGKQQDISKINISDRL